MGTLGDYVLPGVGIAGRNPAQLPPRTMKPVEDDSDTEDKSDTEEFPEDAKGPGPNRGVQNSIERIRWAGRRRRQATSSSTEGRRRRQASSSTEGRRRRQASSSTEGRRRLDIKCCDPNGDYVCDVEQ